MRVLRNLHEEEMGKSFQIKTARENGRKNQRRSRVFSNFKVEILKNYEKDK